MSRHLHPTSRTVHVGRPAVSTLTSVPRPVTPVLSEGTLSVPFHPVRPYSTRPRLIKGLRDLTPDRAQKTMDPDPTDSIPGSPSRPISGRLLQNSHSRHRTTKRRLLVRESTHRRQRSLIDREAPRQRSQTFRGSTVS